MTEGQVAGQSEEDVEADREDSEDRKLLQQVGIAGAEGSEDDRTRGRLR